MILLDGKALSQEIKEEIKHKSKELKTKGIEPCLAVILVGTDPASETYVNNKAKACEPYRRAREICGKVQGSADAGIHAFSTRATHDGG